MGQPVVSIVVPVYNVEKYLEDMLDCVTNQTMEGSIWSVACGLFYLRRLGILK